MAGVVVAPPGAALGCDPYVRTRCRLRRHPFAGPCCRRGASPESDVTPADASNTCGCRLASKGRIVAAARVLRTFARRSLRVPRVRSMAMRVAAARHRGLILVYHRIAHGPELGG